MTPEVSGNKSIKKLGVSQKLMLGVKPLIQTELEATRKGVIFRRALLQSNTRGKKNKFLRVYFSRDRQKRQYDDSSCSSWIYGKVFAVVLRDILHQ